MYMLYHNGRQTNKYVEASRRGRTADAARATRQRCAPRRLAIISANYRYIDPRLILYFFAIITQAPDAPQI